MLGSVWSRTAGRHASHVIPVRPAKRVSKTESMAKASTTESMAKASRGFEPRSLDSESRVLTVTPRGQLCTCRHGKLQGLALNSPHHHMQVDTSAVDPTGGHGSSIPSPAHSMPATCMANRCLRGQHEWPNTTCKSTHLLWTRPVDMARQSHRLHIPCQRHAWPTAAFVENMGGPMLP